MELFELERAFKNHIFRNEDEIKIHFHSDIIKPLLEELNPKMIGQFTSETVFHSGGRADATFQNISFELKKYDYFRTEKGIGEALWG